LNFSRILARLRQKRDASGDKNGRILSRGCERHHHGGQSLVAGGDADNSLAGWERPHQAAQHNRSIVAKGQRVHHAGCALRAAIAGIGASPGKGNGVQRLQFTGGLCHKQAHFPVSGMETESNGLSIVGAQAAMSAEDQKLWIEKPIRVPTHAGILT
jgi:hypothetical protein